MVDVVGGIAIRFYAKTETTIRFEVVYSQPAIKQIANVTGIQSIGSAQSAVSDVVADAVDRLNNLLACVGQAECVTDNDASLDELVEVVLAAAPNSRAGVSLLSRLAYHHRISPSPKDPVYPLLRSLKRRGVLVNEARSPRRRNYVVSPRFQQARNQLASRYFVPLKRARSPRKRIKPRKAVR